MKLSENQKDVFYIALTVFLAVGLGIVVFLIVKHFRNKNSNNCTPNCNGKNCGDDGCKGNCGGCQSGQTCGKDGKCSGGPADCSRCDNQKTCGPNCNGDCGGICSSPEQTCGTDGECTGGPDTDCYGEKENPFPSHNACDGGKKLKCCDKLSFCRSGKDYICKTKVKGDICQGDKGFIGPICSDSAIPDCNKSPQFCPKPDGSTCPDKCNGIKCGDGCSGCTGTKCPDGQICPVTQHPGKPGCHEPRTGLACIGDSCNIYNCLDSCEKPNVCVGNVCRPKDYQCIYSGNPGANCITTGPKTTAVCQSNTCYLMYPNPKKYQYGCVSTESAEPGTTPMGDDTDGVQEYCTNDDKCIGYYGTQAYWNVATDSDPTFCAESLTAPQANLNNFFYKQKVN
jgi:hypothetical protein